MSKKGVKLPDSKGYFGTYGGVYVAETLIPVLEELSQKYELIKDNKEFKAEVQEDLEKFVGRPSPLYFAKQWSKQLGGARIYLKR